MDDESTLPLPPARRLGPYLLEQELARGGQGAVYRARHEELGVRVALKVLTGLTADAGARFELEAKLLARLSHRNLPRVSDLGREGAQAYLAMELLEGRDLRDAVLEGGPLAPAQAVEALAPIADALHYCHGHGILHRDVKPANVLLERGGRAVLVDFGLARREPRAEALSGVEGSPLSKTGELKGTPAYMAPEQAEGGGELGPAADVYALGATLYFALTGAPPYAGASLINVLNAVLTKPAPDPRGVTPETPAFLAELCLRAMAKEPQERYPTAAAFAEALRASQAPRPRKRPKPALIGGALLCVLAGAALGRGASRPARPALPTPEAGELGWEQAKRLLEAGSALSAAELAGLEGSSGASWAELAAAESRLRRDPGELEAALAALKPSAERDLLEAWARARAPGQASPRALLALCRRGVKARLPWRPGDPAQHWAALAKRFAEGGRRALAAQAQIEAIAASPLGSERHADWSRAFAWDPYAAAKAGALHAERLLQGARLKLRGPVELADAPRVARGRQELDWFRLCQPRKELSEQLVARLEALAEHPDMAVREAALGFRWQWRLERRTLWGTHLRGGASAWTGWTRQIKQSARDRLWCLPQAALYWLLRSPRDGEGWIRLGLFAKALGQRRLAELAWEQVLEGEAPKLRHRALSALAELCVVQGRFAKAHEYAKRREALRTPPNVWDGYRYVQALLGLGRANAAMRTLETRAGAHAEKTVYWFWRAEILRRQGRPEDARQAWKRALELRRRD